MIEWTWARNRGLLRVGGEAAAAFLQGLVTADVACAGEDRALYGALLTPQGKFLHDFFILCDDNRDFLLEGEASRLADLLQRLKRYRLRAPVILADESNAWRTALAWGGRAAEAFALSSPDKVRRVGDGWAYIDPRLAALGVRIVLPAEASLPASLAEASERDWAVYDARRLSLGVPDGSRDMVVERAFMLESGMDELGAIDWQKGCYVGQEVTARTKYRGNVRRRLTPVVLSSSPPAEPDAPITADGRRVVGQLHSHAGDRGLALLSLDASDGTAALTCGESTVTSYRPDWWRLPASNEAAE